MTSGSMRRAAVSAFVLLAAAGFWVAPVAAQYDDRYGGRSNEARSDNGLLGGLFGRQERPRRDLPQQQDQQAQLSATDLVVRLDRLENQIRQLTGAIEQLQHRNQQLEQQLRRQQEDADYRMRDQGGAQPPRRTVQPQSPQPATPSGPAQRRGEVFDPAENPGAPGAPQTLGSIPPRANPPAVIIDDEAEPQGGRPAGAPLDLATLSDQAGGAVQGAGAEPPQGTPTPREPRTIAGPLPAPPPRTPSATGPQTRLASAPSATPRDEFALAQGYIQRKDYALAEESLREFLKKHPADRLAPEAHYYLGESLFQRQRYRDAAESFLTVSTKFERSARAPDSLMRLGQSLAALGEREAACATLNEVLRKYPKAAAGVRQGVEREQKRVRC